MHPRIESAPLVSVIIPTIGTMNDKGNARFIDDCVASLRKNETSTKFEIVVVTTGTISPITTLSNADRTVVYDTNDFNFAQAVKLGRTYSTGDHLLILNDDTTVAEADLITRMMEIGQIDEVGIVGAKLTYPDGRLQHVGMVMLPSGPTHCWIAKAGKEPGYFGSTLTPRNYSAITAAAMLTRISIFDEWAASIPPLPVTSTMSTTASALERLATAWPGLPTLISPITRVPASCARGLTRRKAPCSIKVGMPITASIPTTHPP